MPKLVVLSEGLPTRTYELNSEKTTIGRVDDNSFHLAEASVSSHHCEILLQGGDVVVRDLNSTNGTFVNGNRVDGESVLKPGQILRLGQIDLRLENGASAPASSPPPVPAPAPAPKPSAPAPSPMKFAPIQKPVMAATTSAGVSLGDLERGPVSTGFDTTSTVFTKKKAKGNKVFIIVASAIVVVLAGVILLLALTLKGH